MIYELKKDRLVLINLAVCPFYRRKGVARDGINWLKGKLSPDRRKLLETVVSERNLQAHLFFKDMEFRATGVERNYYDEPNHDAYRMIYHVEDESR
jgi:ribosomal-protein-alanine N-acetyltransferase